MLDHAALAAGACTAVIDAGARFIGEAAVAVYGGTKDGCAAVLPTPGAREGHDPTSALGKLPVPRGLVKLPLKLRLPALSGVPGKFLRILLSGVPGRFRRTVGKASSETCGRAPPVVNGVAKLAKIGPLEDERDGARCSSMSIRKGIGEMDRCWHDPRAGTRCSSMSIRKGIGEIDRCWQDPRNNGFGAVLRCQFCRSSIAASGGVALQSIADATDGNNLEASCLAPVAASVCKGLIVMSSSNAGVGESFFFMSSKADNLIVSEIVFTRGVSNVGAGLRCLDFDWKLRTLALWRSWKLCTLDTAGA